MDVSKYAAIFLAESREHLSSCNHLLLKWERDPAATDAVGGLFRSIHTIKGMAATMGFTGVAGLAAGMAKILFWVFLILFLVALVFGRRPRDVV